MQAWTATVTAVFTAYCCVLYQESCGVQIVMTANTVVLCYVASPRTPQEHAAASTVSQQSSASVCMLLPLQ